MPPHNPFTTNTARALYRVFVVPTTHRAPRLNNPTSFNPATQHVRHANPYRKVGPAPIATTPFNDPANPLDAAIKSRYVNYVDESGTFHPDKPLQDLLYELRQRNRAPQDEKKRPNEWHLRQVGSSNGRPVVKWTTARDLRAEHAAKAKPQKSAEAATKQLELNWGLDQKGDLPHRLDRLREFLEDGKKVDVTMAPKRRGRSVTLEEMEALIQQVREAAAEVPGAHEWKAAEGKIGRVFVLRFKLREDAAEAGQERAGSSPEKEMDKMAKKEAEKEERRKKEEERQRKAAERKAELERQRTVKVDDVKR